MSEFENHERLGRDVGTGVGGQGGERKNDMVREKQPSGPAGSVSGAQPLSTFTRYLHLASPSSWYNLSRQFGVGLLERFRTHPHLLRILGTQLSTTVGREGPMAWGFIRLPVRPRPGKWTAR